jgi:hypothetical protein
VSRQLGVDTTGYDVTKGSIEPVFVKAFSKAFCGKGFVHEIEALTKDGLSS